MFTYVTTQAIVIGIILLLIPIHTQAVNTTSNPSLQPTYDPTSIPTFYPTQQPTNNPTVEPTIDPTDIPSLEPSIEPTLKPTSHPTFNPTASPTKTPIQKNCDLLRLNLTIRSFNITQLTRIINKKSKFQNIVKNNIDQYYSQENDNKLTVTFDKLQATNNNSLVISYDVLNCNRNIQKLINYLSSSIFNSSLIKTLSDIYYNASNPKAINITTDLPLTIISVHVKTIWSYLPPPLVLETFNINSPITMVFICIFALILTIVITGYFQSKCYGFCSIFGCKLTDNFNPSRVIFFVLATFVLFNNLNTSYAYFYEYSIYSDTIFITLGGISLISIILNIIYDGVLVQAFENDIEIQMDNGYIDSWLNTYRYKLVFFTIISGSFYNSLSLVNSNLFGSSLFGMRLTNKQLNKFKKHKIQHILISLSQLIVHGYFIFYIVIQEHKILHNNDQIAYLSILSIIGCLFNVLNQIIIRCSSTNFQYETTNIDIKIDVDNNIDKIKLQKQKDLTNNIKDLLAKMLEIYPSDIQIINTKESLNGIIISCIKYDKIKHFTKFANKKVNNYDHYELQSIELQTSLLREDESTDVTVDIQSKLSSDKTKKLIQELYGLSNNPLTVSYEINVRLFADTFTKTFSL